MEGIRNSLRSPEACGLTWTQVWKQWQRRFRCLDRSVGVVGRMPWGKLSSPSPEETERDAPKAERCVPIDSVDRMEGRSWRKQRRRTQKSVNLGVLGNGQ